MKYSMFSFGYFMLNNQDFQTFLEKDSWCKINYFAPTEQWWTWENAVIKLKNVLGIWHMFEDFIFITNIKLGIPFAGETDIWKN